MQSTIVLSNINGMPAKVSFMASYDIKIHLELPKASKIFSIGVMETNMMSVVQNGRNKESERVMIITVAAGGVT